MMLVARPPTSRPAVQVRSAVSGADASQNAKAEPSPPITAKAELIVCGSEIAGPSPWVTLPGQPGSSDAAHGIAVRLPSQIVATPKTASMIHAARSARPIRCQRHRR